MEAIITQKGLGTKSPGVVRGLTAAVAIYSMIIPLIIVDIWTQLYQFVYFKLTDIPQINRRDYLNFDRWNLSKLNVWQKINCVYCEYANGIVAWVKDVANQTETYSCAIKHKSAKKGEEHHTEFDPYEDYL